MFSLRICAAALLSALAFAAAAHKTIPTYVMISGWGLYPALDTNADPAFSTLRSALASIGKAHISGIAYGTLGITPRIRAKAGLSTDFDPNAYNRALFRLARERKANLWLQLRYYDNWIGDANLTAPQILSEPPAAEAFLRSAMAAVHVYEEAYPDVCTIILGEEETIYHSKEGGGLFWAGQAAWDRSPKLKSGEYLKQSGALDEAFAANFTGINRLLIGNIRRVYPRCRIGVHIGHAPLYQEIGGTPVYAVILRNLRPVTIDFTFYDLYEKVSRTDADFQKKLIDRVHLLKSLGQPVYYLAQLHTTNNFGAGGGRTPSAHQIDGTVDLAEKLGVDGFGYYTKNAVPVICTQSNASHAGCNAQEDLAPLDPNTTGQSMVWQSSPRRWQYGLSKLAAFRSPPE